MAGRDCRDAGVLVAIDPDGTALGPGLTALALVVLTGSGGRGDRHPPIAATLRTIVLDDLLHAGGLRCATLPFALWSVAAHPV